MNTLSSGLNRDVTPFKLQKDVPTFILNGIRDSFKGEKDSYQSEPGTLECFEPPSGFKVIGTILGDDNEVFIFMTSDKESEIGIFKDCAYTQVVRTKCLGFDSCNLIRGEFRIRNGCERVIYWTDYLNRDRFFNFDRKSLFYTDVYKDYLKDLEDGEEDEFNGEKWDCELFDIQVRYTNPGIEDIQVLDSGGKLELGVYYFVIEVLDGEENVLFKTEPTNPIAIWDEFQNSTFDDIDGGVNIDGNSADLGGVIPSNKSIELRICDLDTSYDFLRVSAIRAITGDGFTTDAVRKGDLVPITDDCIRYVFTGFVASNGDTLIDPAELLVPDIRIEKSKVIEQVQNRLVRANIEEEYRDYSQYQKAASKIGVDYSVKYVDPYDQFEKGNPKNPNTWYEMMNFMGDEVYPVAIKYVHDSGLISPPFHVPGVPLNTDPIDCSEILSDGNTVSTEYCLEVHIDGVHSPGLFNPVALKITVTFEVNGQLLTFIDFFSYQRVTASQTSIINDQWDVWCGNFEPTNVNVQVEFTTEDTGNITVSYNLEYNETETNNNIESNLPPAYIGWDDTVYPEWSEEMAHIIPDEDTYREMIESVGGVYGDYSVGNLETIKTNKALPRRWQIFNTAVKRTQLGGRLAYYETSSVYPDIRDCNNDSIWGEDICGNELAGTPVRYPKLPDRSLVPVMQVGNFAESREWCISAFIQGGVGTGAVSFQFEYIENGVVKFSSSSLDTSVADNNEIILCSELEITSARVTEIFATTINGIEPENIILEIKEVTSGVTSGKRIALLGLNFYNIEYPSDDIVGHIFVRAKKDDTDRTVLDKGVTTRMRENDKYIGFSYFSSDTNDSLFNWMFSPRNIIGDRVTGSYIKAEQKYKVVSSAKRGEKYKGAAKAYGSRDVDIGLRVIEPSEQESPEEFNYALDGFDKIYPPYTVERQDDKKLMNFSASNQVLVNKTTRSLDTGDRELLYAAIKNYREVFPNLFNINYVNMHQAPKRIGDSQEIYAGDTFISNFHITNYMLTDIDKRVTQIILAAVAVALSFVLTVVTVGIGSITIPLALAIAGGIVALGITTASVAQFVEEIRDNRKDFAEMVGSEELDDVAGENVRASYVYHAELLNNIFVESTVNYAMRHGGSIKELEYFGDVTGDPRDVVKACFGYVADRIIKQDPEDEEKAILREFPYPEAYLYNRDYSRMLCEGLSRPLGLTYNYCSKCGNKYPNRIVFSPQSFDNELFDLYRVNKALDFIDIPAEKGEITGIKYKNNQLLVHTTRTSFILKPNPQVLNTNLDNVYVGTGDFLSIPPVELVETDVGYGGSQHIFGNSNSQFNYMWVDALQGKVHSFGQGIGEESIKGLMQWFRENLPFELKKQFPELNHDSLIDSVGITQAFDTRFNRTIIHKKDFLMTEEGLEQDTEIIDGKLYVNGALADFSNKDWFENKSWTISFSHEFDSWTSWHSYQPLLLFNDNNYVYSYAEGKIWKHLHEGNYGKFYDKKYDFVVEYIDSNFVKGNLYNISYFARTLEYDKINKQWKPYDATFDRFVAYSIDRTTGLLNLNLLNQIENPFGNVEYNAETKNVIKSWQQSGENYNIAQIRDISSGSPVMSEAWDNIQDEYQGIQGYMDAVPINYDLTRNQFDQPYISDKWIKTRLFFNPAQDLKMKFHLGINNIDYDEQIRQS